MVHIYEMLIKTFSYHLFPVDGAIVIHVKELLAQNFKMVNVSPVEPPIT